MNEDRGFAFPQHFVESAYGGMTKREYFTGQALAGLCANKYYMNEAGSWWVENPSSANDPLELLVRASVRISDYTLAELAKEKV